MSIEISHDTRLQVKVGDKVRTILAQNKSDWCRVVSVNETDMVVTFRDIPGPLIVPLVSPLWEKIESSTRKESL